MDKLKFALTRLYERFWGRVLLKAQYQQFTESQFVNEKSRSVIN